MSEYNGARKISKIETTSDVMTGRGGVLLFSRYMGQVGVCESLDVAFGHLRGSAKGMPVWQALKQVLCFLFDGTSRHLSFFDDLKRDEGYAAMLEESPERLASSHAVKRLFKRFAWTDGNNFRHLLREIFFWRLLIEAPPVITITVDTMVMDNDEAQKRHGVSPTYKKVKGFQPLQVIWNDLIIEAVFRGGKKNGNAGRTVLNILTALVDEIRQGYRADVPIIVRFDSGFYDEEIMRELDALGVGFVMTGKMYDPIKDFALACGPEAWGLHDNGHQAWTFTELAYRGKSWERYWRSFYTKPMYEGRQMLLDFARPDNVIHTNLGQTAAVLAGLPEAERARWQTPEAIIACHHQRGADELPHRGLKDFGFEQLPFKRFAANNAFYYCMVLGYNLFECFKRDVLAPTGVVPMTSYATTVRRVVVDIAAKVVHTAKQWVVKVTTATFERLKLDELFRRCQEAPALPS